MGVEIFYFSGTGNSIHVARELKRRIPDTTLIPIIRTLKRGKIESKADTVGVVFPIHAHTYPWVVEEFLKRVVLHSASYVFALSNRECADKVFSDMNKLLMKRNFKLDGSFAVNTPENFVPIFKLPTKEEVMELENKLQEKLDKIQGLIANKTHFHENTGPLVKVLANTLLRVSRFMFQKTRYFGLQKSYYADDKCTGCGTCEKICLSNKIQLVNKKPTWNDNIACTYCFACISYCPSIAIQARRKRTKNKGRYHHPLIKVNDIAEQK